MQATSPDSRRARDQGRHQACSSLRQRRRCVCKREVNSCGGRGGDGAPVGGWRLAARQDPATASAPREIEVVASRFAFEPAQIEVTEGERIRLLVRSADGVHGIEIKRFRVNRAIPRGGKPVTIECHRLGAGHLRDSVLRILWRWSRSHDGHAGRAGQAASD